MWLYEEPFVDFATTRNVLLQKCKNKATFVLLLDANDEVKNGELLRPFLLSIRKEMRECVMSVRFIIDNDVQKGKRMEFTRIAILRNGVDDIYYEMPVHERITCKTKDKYVNNCNLIDTPFHIYQDRLLDKSSGERHVRDLKILENLVGKEDTLTGGKIRLYYFICQTATVVGDFKKLREYASKLIAQNKGGEYNDYIFFGYLHMGVSGYWNKLGKDQWLPYLMMAQKYCNNTRCEGFYNAAIYLMRDGEYEVALLFAKKACEIPQPSKTDLLKYQFDFGIYEKKRWDLKKQLEFAIQHNGKINVVLES